MNNYIVRSCRVVIVAINIVTRRTKTNKTGEIRHCSGPHLHNVRVAEQVKELVHVRDGMDEWLLERGKINDIINYLCID